MVTIGCPEVPLEFSVLCFQKGVRRTQVAAWGHGCGSFGGRIRISTSRCPEVGLEFQLHAVFGAEGELIAGVTPLPESRATARRREENVFGVLDFWAG